jgi:hypothetical protein
MKRKIPLVFILWALASTVLAHEISAAEKPGHRPPFLLPVDGGAALKTQGGASPLTHEMLKTSDCTDILPQVMLTEGPDTWAQTYYDYQNNGSMGRMIAVGPAGHRQMVCHETRGDYAAFPRYVTYNCKDALGDWLGSTHVDGGENVNAGYPQMLVTHDGREVILYHRVHMSDSWHSALAVGDHGQVCSGSFANLYDLPDKIDFPASSSVDGLWPKGCIVYRADADIDYIHYLVSENNPELGGAKTFAYARCAFQGDSLICASPGYGPYARLPNTAYPSPLDKIAVVDTIMTLSPVMVTSLTSQRVAVVYAKNRDNFSTAVNNDVVYIESTNMGKDWLDGTNWPATRHNITNYATEATERAYTDVAACYDFSNNLHIVWNGCYYDSVTGQLTYDANLYHWSQEHGISMIAWGYWEDTAPGAWNRNLCKMSVSALDPIYHPGGYPDSVFLYCTWTQFNPGDMSLAGWSNGDIYASLSVDGGKTWAPGYNLTNTQTPDCDEGNCLSEHWSSMAENMYDGDLHIEYVCDRDAGGIVIDEGYWTDNDMMYVRFDGLFGTYCGMNITYGDPSSFTVPPIKVSPDKGTRVVTFDIRALGDLGGSFEATSDHGSVAITGNSSGYLSPGQTRTVEVTIACSVEGFISATITITGCIGTEDETIIELPLYAVCSNDYYECDWDPATFVEKDNGTLKLWTCANSSQELYDLGIDPEEKQQVIFSGGTIVATTTPEGDTVVGRQDYRDVRTGARDTINQVQGYNNYDTKDYLIQKTYVKDTYIWTPSLDPPNDFKWWWIDIHKQIIMFHGLNCPDWKKDIIVKYVWIEFGHPPVWWPSYPLTYEGHQDIYLGHFADVDAPFDDGCVGCNTAGYDEVRKMVWLHGFYNDTLPEGHPEYEDFYVGLALTDRDGTVVQPWGLQCVRSDSFLYPQGGWGWLDEELYELATAPGVNIYDPDSVVDRTVVMTADMIPVGTDSTFEAEYILIEAAVQGDPGLGLEALQAHMDDVRDTLITELAGYEMFDKRWKPPICGDVLPNGIVDSGDVVRLIGYVFLGESEPPWPVECRADFSGNGVIDSGDIVRMIGCCFLGWWCPPMCPDHCYGD